MRIFGEVRGGSSGDSAHRSVFCTETDPRSVRRLLMRANESGPERKSETLAAVALDGVLGGSARYVLGLTFPTPRGTFWLTRSTSSAACSPAWPPSVWASRSADGPGPAGAAHRAARPHLAVRLVGPVIITRAGRCAGPRRTAARAAGAGRTHGRRRIPRRL
jgi:hypothetical protein